MHEEQMEVSLYLPQDFPIDDLFQVGAMLEHLQILTPGYLVAQGAEYNPLHYLYEGSLGVKFTFLIDRNIASRVAQLAQGMTTNPHRKAVAGLLGFAQCLDIELEPSISFHEVAPFDGNDAANLELAWLRIADNWYPPDLLDIALDRSASLPKASPPADITDHRLDKRLSRWQKNYIVALKIAQIELTEAVHLKRILKLLEWMYKDFILALPAAMYACIYFAPLEPPRGGMFTQLRSPMRVRAIEGVKNSTWDITYLSDFAKRIALGNATEPPKRVILATLDYGLSQAARFIAQESTDSLIAALAVWWPASEAAIIAKTIHGYIATERDKAWFDNQAKLPANHLDQMIRSYEELLMAWRADEGDR